MVDFMKGLKWAMVGNKKPIEEMSMEEIEALKEAQRIRNQPKGGSRIEPLVYPLAPNGPAKKMERFPNHLKTLRKKKKKVLIKL